MEALSTQSRNCPRCQTEYPPNIEVCPKDNTRTQPNEGARSDHPLLGKFIGSYRVQKQIGAGAAGDVFLCEHPTLGKRVAIKVLKQKNSQDRELVSRFFAEARAVSLLEHPHIVTVLDLSVLPDGRAYYVMEHLEGQSLAKRLAKQKQLLPYEALGLCIELLQALSAAHRKGIIHRDIKPANLFLVEKPGHATQLKLLDFGIAKLSKNTIGKPVVSLPGTILGTPAYMAPEQCFAGDVSPATDLYAVGMVLYEMLAGELPLEESESPRRASSHLRERCPGLPAAMEVILARALDPMPNKRFSSAEEMATALRALQTQLPPPNEESMLAATNPRVLLPTPKAGNATVDAISPPKPSSPKALYIPPPNAAAQEVVNGETPTTPIHQHMPPLVVPRVTKLAPKPETEIIAPTIVPPPVVHKTTHPAPQNIEPERPPTKPEAPITERRPPNSRLALWIAILLGGLLALGVVILWKLQDLSKKPTETAAPAPQEVSIAVGVEPTDAKIIITANSEIIAEGNGVLETTAPAQSQIIIEISRDGYQNHKQRFTAKADAMLKIQLAPTANPSSQATVTFLPPPPKKTPNKPTDKTKRPNLKPNDSLDDDPLTPNSSLDDDKPQPNDSLDDDPPADKKAPPPNDSLDDPAPKPADNKTPAPNPTLD